MVCENCGQQLKTLTTFCPSCGALVKNTVKPVLAPLPGQTTPIHTEKNESVTNNENVFNGSSVKDESYIDSSNGDVRNDNTQKTVPPQSAPVASPYSYGVQGAIPQPVAKDNSWAGIVSLVMGILSVLSCGAGTIVVVLAIVFGVIGLKTSKRKLSIAGIVLAVISLLIFIALVALMVFGFWSAMPLIDEAVLNEVFSL